MKISETLATIRDGVFGGLTFGMYHSVVSSRQMAEFNDKIQQPDIDMEKDIAQVKLDIIHIRSHLDLIYGILNQSVSEDKPYRLITGTLEDAVKRRG